MHNSLRIGLDIDGVIANFAGKVVKEARKDIKYKTFFPKSEKEITTWGISDMFTEFMEKYWMDKEFWMDIDVLNKIDFCPTKYITARPIDTSITKHWLRKHKFPDVDVVTVRSPKDKLHHLDDVDIFIDDYYETVRFLRTQGICAYLFDAPYQVGCNCKDIPKIHDLSYKTISKLYEEEQEIKEWLQG